ncbi:MAG: riboflavin biosynthesis protein RibF [Atopobiaceae bacterium]|jgi:riboflavin kinase/FMN adenylyltransferase|nr:riboflavin biosynthesis protein RibF [Atopobiaceae bacterium]MDD2588228.1 riboflavin biosynthesis protein RibF [Atopobiaceae bacterium]MDD3486437.1 riboflavin biosynthesis protein RibF [Atopobiaceae bacterium]MDD4380630.1 riboflavin biosynthesis protein RibF [Atopobiaceae bacterium]
MEAPDAARLVSESVLAGVDLPPVSFSLREALLRGIPVLGTPSVVAIGAFDGVHMGHRELLRSARADAEERGCPFVVVTFDPDPARVLAPERHGEELLCHEDRLRALSTIGALASCSLAFDAAMASMRASDFIDDILIPLLAPVSVHVGSDFCLGAGGEGTVSALAAIGRARGFDVTGHDLVVDGGVPVTATRIRGLLGEGRVAEAARLMGRHHFVRGQVLHGRGEGHTFGFPTANVTSDLEACLPADGVYAGFVRSGSEAWPAAINVGAPPSFSGPRTSFLEANLLGFEGNLYGAEVEVVFADWLRASRRFTSLSELAHVVRGNIDWVHDNLGGSVVGVRA